jgi:alkylation response protein AidB-like acyl-CoA dehydrogenase
MALTLARIADKNGHVTEGSKGLSLFYLETRDKHGHLNNIQIQRLKNKLGTRQLPTGEMLLDGTWAHKVQITNLLYELDMLIVISLNIA